LVSPAAAIAFLTAEIGMGILVSVSVLLVDEIAFHTYPEFKQARALCAAAILENLGFRQLVSCWRLIGLWQSMTGAKVSWGSITRTAAWRAPGAERH
ncbi:MAG: glycosyltransferase family 2 protein, partial [Nitrospira sp.]|nr:glycosyltransferase family 2 protein [Nitrospira sp.]